MWTWTCLVWFLSKMTKLLSLFWRKLNVNSPDRFRFFDKNWTKHNRVTVGITYLRNKAQKIWRLWKMKLLSFDSFEFCAKMLKLKFELKTYRLVDTCEKQQQKLDVHNWCKCFTCVTKTIANLTTNSRKPGDYNGTIIFEIDIMKNSSPLNLIFTFFAMSKPK